MSERFEKYAKALLAAPDPVFAIAHALAEQDGRIDVLARRLSEVCAAFDEHRKRAHE